jgi:hypothetical protein
MADVPTTRIPRTARWLAIPLVVLAAGLGLTACAPAKPVVMVYGDSLVWQSKTAIAFLMGPTYDTRVISTGGSALCDYQDAIANDARDLRPAMVVLAFSGNAITPCMQPPDGRSNDDVWIAEKYRADVTRTIDAVAGLGVPTLIVGSPPKLVVDDAGAGTPATPAVDALALSTASITLPAVWAEGQRPDGYRTAESAVNDPYREVVAAARARGVDTGFVDGGAMLRSTDGGWTKVLPCLPIETASADCVDGLIHVRAPDLGHFCPVVSEDTVGDMPNCPVWSSGGVRYALTIAGNAIFRLAGTVGALDRVTTTPGSGQLSVSGWAIDPGAGTGAIDVHVYVDQAGVALTADQSRPDLSAAYPLAGPDHGFSATIATSTGTHTVCAYAITGPNPVIGCKVVTVT